MTGWRAADLQPGCAPWDWHEPDHILHEIRSMHQQLCHQLQGNTLTGAVSLLLSLLSMLMHCRRILFPSTQLAGMQTLHPQLELLTATCQIMDSAQYHQQCAFWPYEESDHDYLQTHLRLAQQLLPGLPGSCASAQLQACHCHRSLHGQGLYCKLSCASSAALQWSLLQSGWHSLLLYLALG